MLNTIKSEFTIKDLETFSNIKAHTIRIWEKRYDLLKPNRTESNIRYYDVDQLLKLLNITNLYTNGLKISKIASLSENQILERSRELMNAKVHPDSILNSFKMSMINFDEGLFNASFDELLKTMNFGAVFREYMVPFLFEIGNLWQLKAISPVHEHFISNLLKQKIHGAIEKLSIQESKNKVPYILYLPPNEIHEIGLLYMHYELLARGLKSIYLGQSVPTSNLLEVLEIYSNVNFVTYLTVEPSQNSMDEFMEDTVGLVNAKVTNTFYVFGQKVNELNKKINDVHTFSNPNDFLVQLDE
jgi:DNA-binding transcriptional MerR regulator